MSAKIESRLITDYYTAIGDSSPVLRSEAASNVEVAILELMEKHHKKHYSNAVRILIVRNVSIMDKVKWIGSLDGAQNFVTDLHHLIKENTKGLAKHR